MVLLHSPEEYHLNKLGRFLALIMEVLKDSITFLGKAFPSWTLLMSDTWHTPFSVQ